MEYAAIIAAIIGAISAGMNARAQNAAAREVDRRYREAVHMVGPAQIGKLTAKLIPRLRASIAPTLAPILRETVARNVARAGLSGSGAGLAAANAAATAPEIEVFRQALDRAVQISQIRAELTAMGARDTRARVPVGPAALLGGAAGYFAASKPKQPNTASPSALPTIAPGAARSLYGLPPNLVGFSGIRG